MYNSYFPSNNLQSATNKLQQPLNETISLHFIAKRNETLTETPLAHIQILSFDGYVVFVLQPCQYNYT